MARCPTCLLEAPESLPPLPAAIEVAIYRIVDEALTNVLRHAHARTCFVRLKIDERVELEITDDGVGLPASMRIGVGLLSMREPGRTGAHAWLHSRHWR